MAEIPSEHQVGSTSGVKKSPAYGSGYVSALLQPTLDEFRAEKGSGKRKVGTVRSKTSRTISYQCQDYAVVVRDFFQAT